MDNLKFLDETGCNLTTSHEYARSERNTRAVNKVPDARGKQRTIVGVLGTEGIENWCQFDGAMNEERMITYIETELSKIWNPENFLCMDNWIPHKTPLVLKTLEKHNIKYIFLPPYHPELNPIEIFWSLIKSYIKSIRVKTKETLHHYILDAFLYFRNTNVVPFFKKCGYFLLDIVREFPRMTCAHE